MYSFSWYSLGLALFGYVEDRLKHGVEEIDARILGALDHIREQGDRAWDHAIDAALGEGMEIAVKHVLFKVGPDSKYAGKPPQDVLRDSIQPGAKKD